MSLVVSDADDRALEEAVEELRDAYKEARRRGAWGTLTLDLALEEGRVEGSHVREGFVRLVKKRRR